MMAAATAWVSDNDDEMTRLTANGLLLGIQATTNLNDVKNLIKDLFNFEQIELYKGLKESEALFIMTRSDYISFENALQIFPEKFQIKLLNESSIQYSVNFSENTLLNEFMFEMKQLCGCNQALSAGTNVLECTAYQKSIIDKYLKKKSTSITMTRVRDSTENFIRTDSTDHKFRYHHKLKGSNSSPNLELNIILAEKDMTKLNKVECILSPVCINSQKSISNKIKSKAGLTYEIQFYKNLDNFAKSSEKNNIFHISCNADNPNEKHQLGRSCKFVLHAICPQNWSRATLKETYLQLYDLYLKIFNYAGTALKVESLAITFLGIRDEFEFSMVALYESLNDYLSKATKNKTNRLSTIYIVAFDKDALTTFKSYLSDGYDENIRELIFSDEVNDTESSLCQECNSNAKFLITKSQIENNNLFKECRASRIKLFGPNSNKKCPPCSVINNLAQTYFQKATGNIVCLKCCVESFVKSLGDLHCSVCLSSLKASSRHQKKNNKFCNSFEHHQSCDKCANVPLKFAASNCYCCNFYEFCVKMLANEEDHYKLNCGRDFCHLDKTDDGTLLKLACGHAVCQLSQNSNNICSFCSISKCFDLMKTKVTEIMYAAIEEELKISREAENSNLFHSYYEKVQNNIKKTSDVSLEGGIMQMKHLDEENCDLIQMGFFLPDGTTLDKTKYHGIMVRYFLPNNSQGNLCANKMAQLFEEGKLFTIGPCKSDKEAHIVVLRKNVDLKTSKIGGPENNGYPDSDYLKRLSKQLELLC
jgi:hypothetical protein